MIIGVAKPRYNLKNPSYFFEIMKYYYHEMSLFLYKNIISIHSPLFHLKSKFLAFWHYYKVENSIFEPGSHPFFIWNQNFWLSDTITRLKFDFELGFEPFLHLKSKFLAFWHYYKVEIRFLSLDFTNFSSEIKRTWLFDTIIR